MGIRYPECRTCRPREIGGRHVRKEEEGGREGGPEGLRQAHQARAEHGPEDAGARASYRQIARELGRCVSSRGLEQKEHRKLSSLSIGSAHAF